MSRFPASLTRYLRKRWILHL